MGKLLSEGQMIEAKAVFEAVPERGAERGLSVFIMARRHHEDTEAFARGVLAYLEWQSEQGHEARMLCALTANKVIADIRDARSKYRNRVNVDAETVEA
jgi:hypothetical protein